MIKNLNQMKKALKPGTRFQITAHCRPECVGQLREITVANTQGFYSGMAGEPDHPVSRSNGGRGSVLWWSKAPFWDFSDGICSLYNSDAERTEKYLILAFRVLEKEAA
ncbi:hypothetical protein [Lacrimispora saccharolytica]|uniref:Uncharacterized protein n=1 Tax=Lacrimispora saccharolytica (strain ATCC 35040 / DSM 2544 / NRCC 2533 / WM1) TaxID=610130 RepID=D9R7J7_LACSW|nr:hypothetical protein [Lacrimispora saccharolytica]ADL03726.1 hypothetical protein Closa_1110 [[Clostridium] saccharolyticum WM1]QRV18142.1 hypothetical protein I6K70_11225 [Lacrimispora saccharolytica]